MAFCGRRNDEPEPRAGTNRQATRFAEQPVRFGRGVSALVRRGRFGASATQREPCRDNPQR